MFHFSSPTQHPSELSTSKQSVLRALVDFESENGYAPTVRELSRQVGSAVSTVHAHLESLERKGLAFRSYRSARGWRAAASYPRAA